MSVDMNALIRLIAQRRGGAAEPPARGEIPTARPLTDDAPAYPSEGGYRNPDIDVLPAPAREYPEEYPPNDGTEDPLTRYGPDEFMPMRPNPVDPYSGGPGGYDNYDENAYARWVQEVEARGNEVRETSIGTFEVAAGTNNIVSRPPSPYPLI